MKANVCKLVAGGVLGAVLTACASSPVPNEKIAVAKAAVQRAEQAGAPELAPVELAAARDKVARAEKAAADHDGHPAAMLAEQANVDAELAEATAQQHRSHKSATEFDASMQALRQEANRGGSTTAPSQQSAPAQPSPPPQAQ